MFVNNLEFFSKNLITIFKKLVNSLISLVKLRKKPIRNEAQSLERINEIEIKPPSNLSNVILYVCKK